MNELMIQHADIDAGLIPILDQVSDPEIPVLTILDMGVVRYAKIVDKKVLIKINGIFKREFSIINSCISLTLATETTFKREPTCPFLIFSCLSLELLEDPGPVKVPPTEY